MNAIESDEQAGYPPANLSSGNPSEPQSEQSSFSCSPTRIKSDEERIDECMHYHHGGIGVEIPAEVEKAYKDLTGRTWRKSIEMNRDDRRLRQRYEGIIEEARAKFAPIARQKWLDCPKCSKNRPN